MTVRYVSAADIARALLSPDPNTQTWMEVVELFVAAGWDESIACPFCGRRDLSVLYARAGANADLRRWIFCEDCGERVSIPAVCSN
jgi:hypothetical protein